MTNLAKKKTHHIISKKGVFILFRDWFYYFRSQIRERKGQEEKEIFHALITPQVTAIAKAGTDRIQESITPSSSSMLVQGLMYLDCPLLLSQVPWHGARLQVKADRT